ncbi:alpha/beta hydrolase [Chryseolinea sp. H1M3-3]|uniref:dienelactone hydrolase family protein n=1 Tax=Chryseolinea sp. H1M3-3 TaxID=3034144 RepID=UPI0023EE2429|nr:alpha/beta hydrolase [Chryseolinea sp. H1M3-3]
MKKILKIEVDNITLEGELTLPENASGLVIFSHGSGSSRFSPRNNFVAQHLQRRELGTFLFDLLTKEEDEVYSMRFNIELLAQRLVSVTQWLMKLPGLQKLTIGYFGASTGAASAITAAAILESKISAVVSRGGRPDLAKDQLYLVEAPTLFIVGEDDQVVLDLNRSALEKLAGPKKLEIIKGATHLFEEPGTLEQVAQLSGDWFTKYLIREPAPESRSTGSAPSKKKTP